MEPGKKELKSIQGLSSLAMLCLHLFCRTEYQDLYRPIFYFMELPFCYYLALLSDFCVFGYAFCSGYAHYVLKDSANYMKGRMKSLSKLIANYWIILIVFCVISLLCGNGTTIPGSFGKFFGNMFLYRLSYNGAWWYLITYIVIVCTSKVVLRIIEKYNLVTFGILAAIYFVSYVMRFKFPSDNFFIRQGYLYGMTLFQYAIGVYFNKYKVFTKVATLWRRWDTKVKPIVVVAILIAMLLVRGLVIASLFVAPITGIIILLIIHVTYKEDSCFYYFLNYIGNHSTNIWLTHMFFYLNIFINLVFVFDNPILIFIFMLFLTLTTSYGINFLKKPVDRFLEKYWER